MTEQFGTPLASTSAASHGTRSTRKGHERSRADRHQSRSGIALYRLPKRRLSDWVLLGMLLAAAIAAYFINLTASGYANEFYSAAAQAGSVNWESFLWGSLDSGNAITVDKPPASIWLMALSVRIFGLSSFAILLPQAIMGVLTTYLLYATIRRYWGNTAGLTTGIIFVLTPVAALMFRFNNPDALLILLMVGAAHAVLRALEYAATKAGNRRRTWWMILAGVLIGFGFLTKQMQVFLVLPGFALAFLIASPTGFWRRIVDGFVAVGSIIVAAGWWVALTVLVPSGSRPYIGGSQNNSFLELTFGYNGFGRLTGSEEGSVVPGGSSTGGTSGGMWGETGWTRLFDGEYGTQIAWLAPLAFAGIFIGLIAVGRAVRIDLRRASVIVFGGWLVVIWLTFSFMAGIFHQYYTVALAPAVAVLAAIAVMGLWVARKSLWSRIVAPALMLVSAYWAFTLAGRSSWLPWLKWCILGIGILAAIVLIIAALASSRRIAIAGIALSAVSLLSGPFAWTAYTISTGHTGSIVLAGPSVTSSTGMGGMGGGMGQGGGPGGNQGGTSGTSESTESDTSQQQYGSNQEPPSGGPGQNSGSAPEAPNPSMGQPPSSGNGSGTGPGGAAGGTMGEGSMSEGTTGSAGEMGNGSTGGGMGMGGSSASSKIVSMLEKSSSSYRWAAATTGSQNAASYQLASQKAVMAIGGFNGSDPAPTLKQFKQYVKQGLIHYYIAGSSMGGTQMGGSGAASEIASWVAKHYTATTVDGVTIYDLSADAS
ncbi:ArnT family glycosyltransferase [Bifidobacterium sp.]|uniref:ArnT family glycosyltransferase n=1 Tax=Bifidobacterium sp. TaxID=41200 RepID=UPI0025C0C642|nr:glycosyltransferase family 39 protein [Bifidobacterium sp.]MCI1634918.1 glycosyltransferase family 39 protein [Bifidobacterium sp.]